MSSILFLITPIFTRPVHYLRLTIGFATVVLGLFTVQIRAGASPQLGSMFLNDFAINVPPLDHTAVSSL